MFSYIRCWCDVGLRFPGIHLQSRETYIPAHIPDIIKYQSLCRFYFKAGRGRYVSLFIAWMWNHFTTAFPVIKCFAVYKANSERGLWPAADQRGAAIISVIYAGVGWSSCKIKLSHGCVLCFLYIHIHWSANGAAVFTTWSSLCNINRF